MNFIVSIKQNIIFYSCHCPPGFTGDRCESNVDDCVENKCENNATCIDLVLAYECKCTPGFMGNICFTVLLLEWMFVFYETMYIEVIVSSMISNGVKETEKI